MKVVSSMIGGDCDRSCVHAEFSFRCSPVVAPNVTWARREAGSGRGQLWTEKSGEGGRRRVVDSGVDWPISDLGGDGCILIFWLILGCRFGESRWLLGEALRKAVSVTAWMASVSGFSGDEGLLFLLWCSWGNFSSRRGDELSPALGFCTGSVVWLLEVPE